MVCQDAAKLLGLSLFHLTINKLHFVSETNLDMQFHDYTILHILTENILTV